MTIGKIGKYSITRELGRGAMGIVYLGQDPMIGRPVAIKTIRFDLVRHAIEQENARKRFMREAQSAGRLSHPNIVTIYEVGEDQGMTYIAMQHVEGKSLDELLISEKRFSVEQVVCLVSQIGDALDYAHERGIIHRDIKPANILVDQSGNPFIVDFGIARVSTSTMTQTSMAMGTPYYMSPEQISGQKVDNRADIFSLGAVMYELLTQKKPFPGENITTVIYRIMNEQAIPVRKLRKDLPSGLDKIIQKALAKDPESRYRNCWELVEDLKKHIQFSRDAETEEELTVDWSPGRTEERVDLIQEQPLPQKVRSRKPLLVTLAAMMVVIAVVVGGVLIYTNRNQEAELSLGKSASLSPVSELNARLYAAKQFWGNKKYAEALSEFQKVLAGEPQNFEVKLSIATIHKEQGQIEKAITGFEETIALNAQDPRPYLYLGEVFEQNNETAKALDYYQLYLERAQEGVDLSEIQNKVIAMESSLQAIPPAVPAKSETEAGRPQPKAEEQDIIQVEKQDETQPEVSVPDPPLKPQEEKVQDKVTEPEPPKIEPAPKEMPPSPTVKPEESIDVTQVLSQGIEAFNNGDYPECIKKMEEVLNSQPENKYAGYYLSLAKKRLEESQRQEPGEEKGEEKIKDKVEVKEEDSLDNRLQGFFEAARADYQAGRYDRAIAQFRHILELDGSHIEARKYLHATHLKIAPGELESLVKDYIEAIKSKSLNIFYQNSCAPALYQNIKRDTDLLLNLYDEFQAIAENINTNVQNVGDDHYRAEVSFSHIMTGLSRAKGAREVLFEGKFIWAVEKKNGAWLIMNIEYNDQSQENLPG